MPSKWKHSAGCGAAATTRGMPGSGIALPMGEAILTEESEAGVRTTCAQHQRHDNAAAVVPCLSTSELAVPLRAGDPQPWMPGVARPEALGHAGSAVSAGATLEDGGCDTVRADAFDVSLPRPYAVLQGLVSLGGAAGLVLLLPFAILLFGLPVALGVRGMVEAVSWLLARLVG